MAALIAAMGWVYTRERQREDNYNRFLIERGITEKDVDDLTKTLDETKV
jgi:hypothetical protein